MAPMLGLAALSALAACAPSVGQFPPACPQIGILKDGADVTRFRGNGSDLTDMVIDGRITGARGKCALDDESHLRTSISAMMDVARGPANPTRKGLVVYFVSVTKGTTILDERDISVPLTFQENSDHVQFITDPVELVLPVDAKTSGAAYHVRISYRLSPQELAFNRRRGAR